MEFAPDRPASFALTLGDAQAAVDGLGHGWRVSGAEPLAGGTKDVFLLTLEERPAIVLKTYGDGLPWRLPKEAYVASLIAGSGDLPAARWLLADDSRQRIPRPFALISRLPGRPLSERSGRPEAADLYRQAGALLRRLHDIAMPAFGYILGDGVWRPSPTNRGYMAAAFEAKFRDFAENGGDAGLLDRIQLFVADRLGALDGCGSAALCHNDIHPGNLLAGQDERGGWSITGLVDLENAAAADPLFDLAKALDQIAHDDPPGRDPFLEGYGPVDRPDAGRAIELYRAYHKMEMWNWLAAGGQPHEAPGPAGLISDLARMTLDPGDRGGPRR